eukprot:4603356-Prorocentrum_lima.AAC.1
MIKGKKPLKEVKVAQPVPENKFAETHPWIKKGQVKGRIALFVDDMVQAAAKANNVEFLKALGKKHTGSARKVQFHYALQDS